MGAYRVIIYRLPASAGEPNDRTRRCFGASGPSNKEIPVAAVCDICAKGPGFGHNVPWSKKKTNRRWSPNIQRVRATVNGAPKRLNVCTSCLKAGKVTH